MGIAGGSSKDTWLRQQDGAGQRCQCDAGERPDGCGKRNKEREAKRGAEEQLGEVKRKRAGKSEEGRLRKRKGERPGERGIF